MSEPRLDFRILYALGSGIDPIVLSFSGRPEDSAVTTIVNALAQVGRSGDGDGTDLKLSPADVLGNNPGAWDTNFLILDGEETLSDLRTLIGRDDSKVLLRQGSWGGGDGPEYFRWVLSDFLPFARNLLEAYGAVEVMKATGRAIEAKRHRESRDEAKLWVRNGGGEVHGLLRDQVFQYHSWTIANLRKHFGVNDGDAGQLMKACGYDYDPASKAYYRLDMFDGLDLA